MRKYNSIKLPVKVKQLAVQNRIDLINNSNNEKLKQSWFVTDRLLIRIVQKIEEIFSFAVKQAKEGSIIFVPKDDGIEVLRAIDFSNYEKKCDLGEHSATINFFKMCRFILFSNPTPVFT